MIQEKLSQLNRHGRGWFGLLLLVLATCAGVLLWGYDSGLPIYESIDERVNLYETYSIRGLIDAPLTKPGYPPGVLYVNAAMQQFTERVTGQSALDAACEVILHLRLFGVLTHLLTATLLALTVRKLFGDAAGLIAPLAWVCAPELLRQTRFAFPQTYEALLFMLALYMAVLAVEHRAARYAVISLLAGLGAVLFKYTLFPVLGLGVGAALWHLRSAPRRFGVTLALQFGVIALCALALFLFGGAGDLAGTGHVESQRFLEDGFSQILDPALHQYIQDFATDQIGMTSLAFFVLITAGSVACFWREKTTWKRLAWIGALGLGLSHTLFLAAYAVWLDGIGRNLLTSSPVYILLAVGSIFAIASLIGDRLPGLAVAGAPASSMVVVCAAVLVWLLPQTSAALEFVRWRDLPVTYAGLVAWADHHIPAETLIVDDNRPFTPEWSCDPGRPRVAIWTRDLTDQPIEDWLAEDVYYAQLTRSQVDALSATSEGQAYLDQMTELVAFPPPGEEDNWRDFRRGLEPEIVLYRLWSDADSQPMDISFGDVITVTGYTFNSPRLTPGDTLQLTLYSRADARPATDYNVYVHLTPTDDRTAILAQADGTASRLSLRQTSTWDTPGEQFISRPFNIPLPTDLAPGEYSLRLGFYDWQDGSRLTTSDGQDYTTIALTVGG